jgi:arylsulfatase A-like enzyme
MMPDIIALLAAGIAAALLEVVWVLTSGHSLFLSLGERGSYAAAALTALPALVLLAGLVLRPAFLARTWARRLCGVYALLAAAGVARATWLLTEGRRVRDLPVRPVIVVVVALLAGAATFVLLEHAALVRAVASERVRRRFALAAGAGVVVLLALDALVLPRGYPVFHLGLTLLALSGAALVGSVHPFRLPERFMRHMLAGGALLVLLAPLAVMSLGDAPNASFAVRERAPWSGKLLRLLSSARPEAPPPRATAPAVSVARQTRGIDLRDQDVLLISVDALRADVVGPRTPEIERLAAEGVQFERAYTPTPNTSYALTSLLTAKFMKPVIELPGAARDHTTLPDILRRYGYRTAAFYPPAIFFVDGARFGPLSERGFGFEYQKKMYASAPDRVGQLRDYMAEVEAGHPLFVWVHLFEPHEPYEPPAELVKGDGPRGRYEGEVALCDRAIGELVRVFRAARPGATVIVTADHGEEFGEHGGSYHGTTLYEEQARVPLVWSSPGKVNPGVVSAPVELVDIGTTLLSALGMPRDARMRGDDFGALLADPKAEGPRHAFAAVDDRNMVSDGRLKLLCAASDPHCQLFDLASDPLEQTNLATERTADAQRLRGELGAFLSSIPKIEIMALSEGVGFPAALARAQLRAPGAGPDVVPLLGDPRPSIRAAAARALGELDVRSALPLLTRARSDDSEPTVRAEAAIASLLLGDDAAAEAVVPLLGDAEASAPGLARDRRAALALSRLKRSEALPALSALALDADAQEGDRLRAIAALGVVGTSDAIAPLSELLEHVRLCTAAARALAQVGGRRAADALARALKEQRYEPLRGALAQALATLGDRRTRGLVEHYLGMETSIPGGVRLLMESHALDVPSAGGALIANPRVREGAFECAGELCKPGEGAAVELPARGGGQVRATFLVHAGPNARLLVDGEELPVTPGESQVSVVRKAREAGRFAVSAQGDVALIAVVVAKLVAEIPPPEPEPWDAGTP